MPYELLNVAQATPHRIHALLRLVPRLEEPRRQRLLDLLQPESLVRSGSADATEPSERNDKQYAATQVFLAALNCGLIREDAGSDKTVILNSDPSAIESVNGFKEHLQQTVLGVTEEDKTNQLFNMYTAWYAVQNERIFQFDLKDFETRFNNEIYRDSSERQFNNTKLNGWRVWAAFLGFGWVLKANNRRTLIPDAHDRIKPLLSHLVSAEEGDVPFGSFMQRLAVRCPELDGGPLFEYCLRTSRPEQRGNTVSLMLSTGLRSLHDEGAIVLKRGSDALTSWRLFPAQGHAIVDIVTHIRLGAAR